ncbi:putative regulatory protein [Streptomyces ambofaciens ATCC 23877]|uniref:Putative regulatory protein n=1 Tax=Streptomyces ambofaciens (strain ATCC 23877 / 3486 / DSM 40053 / JCM 4204 / NBRC 12836 / NRRL B-2516) TaxID=278992 RepID=A0AD17_STRA7|nr:hypothetical protein [Streptomyces ambofaciens]AKZ59964.1 putative regulatory protein [Streptomyces ambofaciens ATCC 23877]CAJ88372.1 putative regulatory protein [Streptomyces ambofaciens ATCC 23877]
MSESTMQAATELASQYSVQVTDDLERNVKEQERVSAEITALQQQLAALQHDHALLVNVQQALGIAAPPAQQTTAPEPAATEAATVPAPRDSATTEPATGKRTRGGKTTAAPKRATAPKSGAKSAKSTKTATTKQAGKATAKPATKAARKPAAKKASTQAATGTAASATAPSASSAKQPAQPTLVELVRKHLTEQKEPRSAAEVTTALGEAHSGRTIKTTVVRTTLEGLVAKNLAQRTKQGTSVYYTATEASGAQQKQDTGTETPDTPGDN